MVAPMKTYSLNNQKDMLMVISLYASIKKLYVCIETITSFMVWWVNHVLLYASTKRSVAFVSMFEKLVKEVLE